MNKYVFLHTKNDLIAHRYCEIIFLSECQRSLRVQFYGLLSTQTAQYSYYLFIILYHWYSEAPKMAFDSFDSRWLSTLPQSKLFCTFFYIAFHELTGRFTKIVQHTFPALPLALFRSNYLLLLCVIVTSRTILHDSTNTMKHSCRCVSTLL